MKLGKLLAAGKSVMNGREGAAYRASKQVYLPNFGSARNPFKSEAAQPVEQDEPKAAEPPAAAMASHATGIPRAEASVASPAPSAGHSKKAATWGGKFNPASIFRVISPKTGVVKAAAGQKAIQATQAELKLDSVKVLHNDLSDVDVEVVPIKSRSSATDLPPAKKSWEFLGERLFGVEAT